MSRARKPEPISLPSSSSPDTNPNPNSRSSDPSQRNLDLSLSTPISSTKISEQLSKVQHSTSTSNPTDPSVNQKSKKPIRWSNSKDNSPLLKTLLDFDRCLSGFPIALQPVIPKLIARAVCRVLSRYSIMPTNLVFDFALLFWRLIVNIFFRSIMPRGAWRIPKQGPVIFVGAPHHNQFLDPILLASEVRRGSGRRVAFLTAAKSLARPFIGTVARLMQSIPVSRAADSAKLGKGYLVQHLSGDSLMIQGVNTQFKKQLMVKGQILLPKSIGYATAEVAEIISDTELKLKKEFKDPKVLEVLKEGLPAGPFDAKEGGGGPPGGEKGSMYKCLPFVDQTQMYSSVYERLEEGGCLGIFPEGGSHDRTDLLPLKAGVVIMALGAMAANPGLKVKIVPVGLSYFHPHKFRSRAVVEFGAPIDVPSQLVESFSQGGDGKRKAVGEMMEIVFDGLKSVTVRAPDYETLMFIQAGRRLYTPPGHHTSLGQVVELNRKFILGYHQHKDDPRVIQLKEDVLKYNKMLAYAGLKDHQVERATRAGWRSLGLLAYRSGLLTFWGGLALPGVILNAPIFILAKIISRIKAKEALAASQVKLEGRDVLATWKVLVSLGVAPVLYVFYAAVATYIAHKRDLSFTTQVRMPIYALIALPTMSYSALKFGEVGIDIYKSLPPLFVSLMPGNHKVIQNLQKTRAKISTELHALIDELAPSVFEDYEQSKIISPVTSKPPPQAGREALIWKEKGSATDGVNSDGSGLLTHPLSWVDERLFGWGTTSSKKKKGGSTGRRSFAGTASEQGEVRASLLGKTQGLETSEETDGEDEDWSSADEGTSEDEGDYEAVFRMLNPANLLANVTGNGDDSSTKNPKSPRSRSHSRSRSGSGNHGETFAEKRNRSSSDLRSQAQQSMMSPTDQRGGFGFSPIAKSTALPDKNGNGTTSNGLEERSRRQRTLSLSEDVSTSELQSPQVHKPGFEQATEFAEKQALSSAGKIKSDMESAEPTPPGSR